MKTHLIIGGSSGIGLACARKLIEDGDRVWIAGRNSDRLDSACSELCSDRVKGVIADVTLADDRARLFDACPELDGFVYSAGGNELRLIQFLKESFVREMTSVHLEVPLMLLSELIKRRKLREGASVVWIGSVAGFRGSPGNAVYASVKAGLMASVKPLAIELAPRKMRINAVAAGLVDTPMTRGIFENLPPQARDNEESKYPLGCPAPEDVAAAVAFLLGSESCKVSGSVLTVDGGLG